MTRVLGLRANWRPIAVLAGLNVFVGGMVGLERTTLPLLGAEAFGLASASAALSFIVSFGLAKAVMNLFAGDLADRYGRRRLLITGWAFGLPVPLLVMWAPHWGWIVGANVLLGVNQSLAWSMTVVMKIDVAGPRRRGLVLGLNEFAGYGGVALASLAAGYIAAASALRPQPFLLGVGFVAIGLLVSVAYARETREFVHQESLDTGDGARHPGLARVFATVSWRDRVLPLLSQGGLVTNLKDGMAWGLFPMYFASKGLDLPTIALIVAIYPAVWGAGQLVTGPLSDRLGRRRLLVGGMWLQALGIGAMVLADGLLAWLAAAAVMGLGTAMVYPTYLAAVSDIAAPVWRASGLGVYRFWRDLGFAVGALLAGAMADALGVRLAIGVTGGIVFASGSWLALRLRETQPVHSPDRSAAPERHVRLNGSAVARQRDEQP